VPFQEIAAGTETDPETRNGEKKALALIKLAYRGKLLCRFARLIAQGASKEA
jgi:hypothetical protein